MLAHRAFSLQGKSIGLVNELLKDRVGEQEVRHPKWENRREAVAQLTPPPDLGWSAPI